MSGVCSGFVSALACGGNAQLIHQAVDALAGAGKLRADQMIQAVQPKGRITLVQAQQFALERLVLLSTQGGLAAQPFVVPAADKPNAAWVGDITYIPTGEGWLYCAVVKDLCTKQIVGYAFSNHIDTSLTLAALGGGMLRQGTRKGVRRTPANRGMRAHRVVKGLNISKDVRQSLCP